MARPPSLAAVLSDAPEFPADAIEVGRIVGAWGIKGAFKVQAYASDPQALFSSKRWFLRVPEVPAAGPRRPALPTLLRIAQAREQAATVVASAHEVQGRDAAEALTGARVFISRASFPTVGDSEYYWVDLIGLAVVNRDGIALGEVTDLIDTGMHSVLRVRRPDALADAAPDQAERLIPFVAAYIDTVDFGAQAIRVDWGLDY
ncbi:MAG: ribosome maturation factor RimM [Burkholderiaceae bacterium]|nr:ribosome maturation factor RimM [Burkholderiaceae bacterium]